MSKRFLALGDSYTVGEGVPPAGCWPMQLAARLRGEGRAVAEPTLVARTGWTTDELAAALDAARLQPPWDLVSLAVGVNNQYRGRALDEYRDQFRGLLRRALRLAGDRPGQVLGVSIPDWGVTPFAAQDARGPARIAAEIDAFNAVAGVEAGHAGVAWIDITAISRSMAARAELVADGLHPAAAQYACWVDAVLPVARAVLGADGPAP